MGGWEGRELVRRKIESKTGPEKRYRKELLCPLPRTGAAKTAGGGVEDRDAAGERRLMQSKHLWDTLSIDWHKLYWKLYSSKPAGHSREHL